MIESQTILDYELEGDKLFDVGSSGDLTLEGTYSGVVLKFLLDRSIFSSK